MTLHGVLPIKISGEKDKNNIYFANTLIRSLNRFWEGDEPCAVTMISLPDEYKTVSENFKSTSNVKVNIIPETEIVPELGDFPQVPGWYKQMIIKLAFSRYVDQPFYMTFDSDMMCVRPLNMARLVHEGRAITQWESKSMHPEWWGASRSLFFRPSSEKTIGLGVTPNMLSAEVARRSLDLLAERRGGSAIHCLLEHSDFKKFIWTEYSFYTEAAEDLGILDEYHQPPNAIINNRRSCIHTECNVWNASDIKTWNPIDWVKRTSHGYFVICQSSTGLEPSAFSDVVEALLSANE